MAEPAKNRLIVTQDVLEAEVAGLVDSAPETLDTLSELAAALGDDPNFATTTATAIGERAKTSDVNAALAGKADLVDGKVPEGQLPALGAPGVAVVNNPDWPGPDPTAGVSSVAIGFGAEAGGGSAAVGNSANAGGDNSAAVGNGAYAGGGGSAAVGRSSYAGGDNSAAVGNSANAVGSGSAAVGNGANAVGDGSAAIGLMAVAENHMQITLGVGHAQTGGALQHEVHVPGTLVLYSPDGSMWALTVSDTGAVSATPWTPPNISPMDSD